MYCPEEVRCEYPVKIKFNKNITKCPKCNNQQFFIFDSVGLVRPILYCLECKEIIAYLRNKDILPAKQIIEKQRKNIYLNHDISEWMDKGLSTHLYNKYSSEYYSILKMISDILKKHDIKEI